MKTYRPYKPDEPYLLPPSPREWLPKGHLVFFIQGLLAGLDLGEIESAVQAKDARGERPFSPTLMTALLLYAYATGVFSSRGIERACVEDVAFRVLAQIAVDEGHQIIVAAASSNQGPDNEYLEPMLHRTVENCGAVHERVTADAGYFSAQNVRVVESFGAEPFIPPGGPRHDGQPDEESHLPNWTDAKRAMRRTLETPRGRTAYARRKATVEPVFGQIRTLGYQHVSFRGLIKNRLEWLFVCASHNVLKLWRAVGGAKLQLAAA